MSEVRNLQNSVQELQDRWDEFIEEEEQARTEYAKYFEEQERIKQELRADRDRLLEKELRMEGHLGPATATSPTRTEINEFSDWEYYDKMMQDSEAQEQMEENENEYYTQSYISPEEAGEQFLLLLLMHMRSCQLSCGPAHMHSCHCTCCPAT